ncbi:inhibitor of KinA [Paenibacillus sp. JGP012]|uniref:5-oxoprolinase subunit PxpB n=1 Tax=Paenibacillus sp. JGP012 TaxID=2735914 RepID=UPI00183F45AF|nr:5-oxoprolinase subunit PxpB [Paenibacillus sp. JGP012]MBB6023328.1 inhibitor of KinA [Paenibacillus sp. JGP012]
MTTNIYTWTEDMLSPLGEQAIVIRCGDVLSEEVHQRVMAVCALLENRSLTSLVEWVPSYLSVTLFYNPSSLSYEETCRLLLQLLHQSNHVHQQSQPNRDSEPGKSEDMETGVAPSASRIVTIPVCYCGAFGPDLEYVAEENQLTIEEVIAIHTSADYLVHMIGFAPGFPYLGGLSERIATARRATPRLRVEAGTVGIGGSQTGIYPVTSPGGWQCIGRTPLRLFRPEENPPSLLEAGDVVRFQSITMQQYTELARKGENDGF